MEYAVRQADNRASTKQNVGQQEDFTQTRPHDNVHMAVPEFLLMDSVGLDEVGIDPTLCSRVSDSTEEPLLQSQTVSMEVMALYMEGEQKLRKVLKNASLEDHEWGLKSYNHHGKAVIIVYCMECKKDFGGTDGQHTKDLISNLFSNFRKSHIMSNQHIRSWCFRIGVDWCNHPQSIAKGKNAIILTYTHPSHNSLVLKCTKKIWC